MADGKPGNENNLKRWFLTGEGQKHWADKPHPWTALRDYLVKHAQMTPERAARVAAQWFREKFGMWPGERKGSNPTGPG